MPLSNTELKETKNNARAVMSEIKVMKLAIFRGVGIGVILIIGEGS